MPSRALVRARYGTVNRPARTNRNFLVNDPAGFPIGYGPVPWDSVNGGAAFWIGVAPEDGISPIGPHGPYPSIGATLPVVTRAVSLLVDPLVTGKFRVRQTATGNPVGELVPDVPRWLLDPHLLRPDARFHASLIPVSGRQTRSTFWRVWIMQAIGWGRSYLYFLTDAEDQPVAGSLRLIHPELVDVVGPDGEPVDDPWGMTNARWAIGETVFDEDGRLGENGRMVELRNPLHPQGVFLAHPEAFKLGKAVERYSANTFRSGIPSGILKASAPNFNKAQADQLKGQWMDAHGGDTRSIAVLSASVDFQAISLSPVDSALGEVKRLAIADVAYAFNLSPEVLGITLGNSATYSNVSQWFEAHRDFSLAPWIAAVEGTLSALLPDKFDVECNLDQFENPPLSDRIATYEVAIRSGLLTVDEARAREGLSPLPPVVPKPPFVFNPAEQTPVSAEVVPPQPQPEETPDADA